MLIFINNLDMQLNPYILSLKLSQFIISMKIFKGIKSFIYKADIFYTAELLRYKDQPEYRTLFGGALSIALIIALIVVFYNKVIDTLNKVIITANGANTNAADPLPFSFNTNPGNHFMFGVQIWGHNLNNDTRYFNIVLRNKELFTGLQIQNVTNTVVINLQPCTIDHWSGFPKIQADFDRLNMSYWKCPPRNTEFTIQGKYASQVSQTLEIAVQRCTNDSDDPLPCAHPDQILNFTKQSHFYTIYFINPLLNPSSESYLNYYLQDNNYIIFSENLGSQGILFMQEFNIQTDQSILPFTEIKEDKGGLVSNFALKNPFQVTQNSSQYCFFSFYKSGMTRSYQRTFQKIDEVLSYIGGLFGTITIFLALVNVYNSYSFQLSLGGYLFRSTSNLQHKFKQYNFFSFIAHGVYAFLQIFSISPNWTLIRQYYNCREQMLKQLDIFYLIERVLFLEKAIGNFFDESQLRGLHIQTKLSLEEARKERRKFKIKNKVIKECLHLKQNKVNNDNFLETTEQYNMYGDERKMSNQQLQKDTPNSDVFEKSQEFIKMRPKTQNKNKIIPIQQFDLQIESDSSSETDEENQTQKVNYYMVQQLIKLKHQADEGVQMSKKIWQGLDIVVKKHINSILMQSEAEIHQELFANENKSSLQYRSNRIPIDTELQQIKITRKQFQNNEHRMSQTFRSKKNQGPSFFDDSSKKQRGHDWSWKLEQPQQNIDPLHVQFAPL